MTIAVDLGRKATKQTNRLQGESIAGKWADRRTLLTYIPHHWGIGILLLHTPVAYTRTRLYEALLNLIMD